MVLGLIAAFIIDRRFDRAATYVGIGAVLAFFGFINGTALGFANSAPVALGYALIGLMCFGLTRYPAAVALPIEALAEESPAE
jgi:AGZA family xanthine/uracil permease-like MFS transporter